MSGLMVHSLQNTKFTCTHIYLLKTTRTQQNTDYVKYNLVYFHNNSKGGMHLVNAHLRPSHASNRCDIIQTN